MVSSLDLHASHMVFIESLQDIHGNLEGFLGFLKHLLGSPKDFPEFLDDLAGFHAHAHGQSRSQAAFWPDSRPGRAFQARPSILAEHSGGA